MFIIAAEISMNGWGCTEHDVGAQVVPSCLAEFAVPAGHTRLDRYTITNFEALHICSELEIIDDVDTFKKRNCSIWHVVLQPSP